MCLSQLSLSEVTGSEKNLIAQLVFQLLLSEIGFSLSDIVSFQNVLPLLATVEIKHMVLPQTWFSLNHILT